VIATHVLNPMLVERQPQILRLPRCTVPVCPVVQDDIAIVQRIPDAGHKRFLHQYAKEVLFQ
jgi:hypothetical protein